MNDATPRRSNSLNTPSFLQRTATKSLCGVKVGSSTDFTS